MQNALAALIVLLVFASPDLQTAALSRDFDDLGCVPVGALWQAIDQKLRNPEPLMNIEPWPKQQR